MSDMRICDICNKAIPDYMNYCGSWDCSVIVAKKNGGKVHTPNGLPVRCIKWNNLMLEHGHGDHPDYKFPVEIEYIGTQRPDLDEQYAIMGRLMSASEMKAYNKETHALIYADGYVAVTMNECCYAMWHVRDGECCGGDDRIWTKKTYKLTQESIDKLLEFTKDMRHAHETKETR
jgi:hypothetical protein